MTALHATPSAIAEEVGRLKKEKNAILLAHSYELPDVQDVADFVGDSLGLAQAAAAARASVIVFCGVHFMAETASILCPGKKVLIPDLEAGCSLAGSVTADQIRQWRQAHPGAVVVSYVNTSAEAKAESDYCCTSSNAVKVVQAIPANREILFVPGMYLGAYVQQAPDKTFYPVKEEAICPCMKMITLEKVLRSLREEIHLVKVAEETAVRARFAIERMLALA